MVIRRYDVGDTVRFYKWHPCAGETGVVVGAPEWEAGFEKYQKVTVELRSGNRAGQRRDVFPADLRPERRDR